jgi:GGDEF domain-containing protein
LQDPDCLLARIGGDEFVFVVSGPNAQFRTEWLAHAAEKALAPSFTIAAIGCRCRPPWATRSSPPTP